MTHSTKERIGAGGVPDGFALVEAVELARLRAVDAKHGWKERAPIIQTHRFNPHKKHPWYCAECGYGPNEPLKHIQPTPSPPDL